METHGLHTEEAKSTKIVFGNGQSTVTDKKTNIGPIEAIVCPDNVLQEDLLSINPFMDIGFKLTLDKDEGTLFNESTGVRIHVRREGKKWSVDLEDLAEAMRRHPCLESSEAVNELVKAAAVVNREPTSIRDRVIQLHERMGHPNTEAMCAAVDGDSPTWIHSNLSASQIRSVMRKHPCLICLLAKRPNLPVAAPSGDRKDMKPGECISADIVPISPPAHDGSTMFFLFADVATGFMIAYTAKAKNSFLTAFTKAVSTFRRYGHHVKIFRSDAETVLKDGDMGRYLEGNGFYHEVSAPEAHYQNFVERYVNTIVRATATLLHSQHFLKSKPWDWALFHAIDCRNRTPNKKCSMKSPYEVLTGRTVNLEKSFQFAFGDLVAVHVTKERRVWKFDMRWDIGIFIGQPEASVDAAIVYYPFDGKVLTRTDLIKLDISDEAYRRYYSARHDVHDDNRSAQTRIGELLRENERDITKVLHQANDEATQVPLTATLIEPEEVPQALTTEARSRTRKTWTHLPAPRVTRSKSSRVEESRILAMAARTLGPKVHEALRSPEREDWVDAMGDEIDTVTKKTGCLIAEDIDTSQPYELVHATMQLKKKMIDAVTVDKRKARLCACGNELDQTGGETYSPTVAAITHSLMLQIAVHDGMHIQLVDTVAAYLNQEYPEDATPLYVVFPRLVALALNLNPDQTYRVKKYIYGLPDSGRAYYEAYSKHLEEHGYLKSMNDPCLFIKIVDASRRVYVWTHVDDTLVAASDPRDIEEFKDAVRERFKITVNEAADQHLGVNIKRNGDGSVKLTQSKLLKNIFDEYLDEAKRGRRRLGPPLKPCSDAQDDSPYDRKSYLHLLGMLNYLLRSRPDLSTALSFAATKAVNPSMSDYQALLDIVFYLWGTRDVGLTMHPGDPTTPLKIRCYVDASYLTHPDGRGHTGYCICIGSLGAFYTKSVKQPLVATSSTHAEVKALYQLVVDLIYVINLCDEIKREVELPAIVFEDNSPTVQLSDGLSAKAKKSKHFLMLVNFIREQVMMGLIEVQKIPSAENIADVLTKALPWKDFEAKAKLLLGVDAIDTQLEHAEHVESLANEQDLQVI